MHRIFVLAGLLVLSTLAWAGKTGTSTCPPSINVAVTLHDYDTTGALLLEKSDDFNSTSQAQYSVTSDPYLVTNISCGNLRFNLYGQGSTTQSIRTMYIIANQGIDGSQPAGPPPGYIWQNVELVSGCYDQNGNQVYLQNVLTSVTTAASSWTLTRTEPSTSCEWGPGALVAWGFPRQPRLGCSR